MENFLLYIGKSALAAGAFYLVYLVLFQNQKQFTFNRIYLPVSLALSFAIPLITFTTVNYVEPVPVESNPLPVFTESFEPVIMQQTQPQFIWEWYHWLFAIYAAGTALFLFRLLLGHGKAWNIIRKSRVQELFNRLVNISKKDIHPFSFFSKIVLSENTLSHPNLEMIIAHESIHVKEKHTLDILFTEILSLLQWFNPFAWLLKDAVKNNLEYKTDHEIAKTTDAQTYQLAMVALADKQGVAPFLTALNGSQLKSRIIMMKKNTKNKYAWLKQLVVLPLLAVLVMGLSNREIKTEIKHLNESTPTHIETQKETTVYDQTTYGNNEHLEDIIISNKDKQIEPVSDAKDNYKIRSDNEQETMILSENVRITQEPDTNVSKKTDKRFSLDNRLYIIDGKEYKGDINDIDVNDIESISVLKGESGLKHYGEKGKNGVVLFATKSGNNPNQDGIATKMSALTKKNQELNKFLISIEFQENQLILEGLEGCAFTNVKFSIADNKPVAINQFGMASARTFNSADNSDFLFEIEKINDQIKLTGIKGTAWKELSYKPAIQKNLVSETGVSKANNPLIVIDGIVTGFKSVDHINPADIQSVTILKDEKAAEKYGVKGKDGVIEITMKPVGIYTKLQLRRFIADEIRYPVLAHKSNLEKTVNLSLKIDTEGKISAITEESLTTDFTLDEVVVVGYKNQDTEVTGYGSKSAAAEAQKVKEQLFEDETKRVIRKISKLDSDKFKGKTVGITVKFILQ